MVPHQNHSLKVFLEHCSGKYLSVFGLFCLHYCEYISCDGIKKIIFHNALKYTVSQIFTTKLPYVFI